MTSAAPWSGLDEAANPWTVNASRVVYDNPWIRVRHDDVTDPSGLPGIYGVVSPKNLAVGVLPFFDDGSVLLVGQYRYALDRYSWEVPEGGAPLAETSEDAASAIARELREESGYSAASWHPLLSSITLSNSTSDEQARLWLAWDLSPGSAAPESTEDLVVRRVPFADVVAAVWDGTIFDSLTVIAVAATEAMRLRGDLPAALAVILP